MEYFFPIQVFLTLHKNAGWGNAFRSHGGMEGGKRQGNPQRRAVMKGTGKTVVYLTPTARSQGVMPAYNLLFSSGKTTRGLCVLASSGVMRA